MAQATDYFLQGANLGMRATQAAAEADMFRTNLAERTRQFNLNYELAKGQYDMSVKANEIEMKSAILQNDRAAIELDQAETRLQMQKKDIEQRKSLQPQFVQFEQNLNQWDGSGTPPPIPSGWPKTMRDEAQSLVNTRVLAEKENFARKIDEEVKLKQVNMWLEGLQWMSENYSQGVTVDTATGMSTYNVELYRKLREQVNSQQRRAALYKAKTEYNKSRPLNTDEEAMAWMKENYKNFIETNDDGEVVFNEQAAKESLRFIFGAKDPRPKSQAAPPKLGRTIDRLIEQNPLQLD